MNCTNPQETRATPETPEPEVADRGTQTRRRRYCRPIVDKRRSVSQATMVGSGGVGGALAGGAP